MDIKLVTTYLEMNIGQLCCLLLEMKTILLLRIVHVMSWRTHYLLCLPPSTFCCITFTAVAVDVIQTQDAQRTGWEGRDRPRYRCDRAGLVSLQKTNQSVVSPALWSVNIYCHTSSPKCTSANWENALYTSPALVINFCVSLQCNHCSTVFNLYSSPQPKATLAPIRARIINSTRASKFSSFSSKWPLVADTDLLLNSFNNLYLTMLNPISLIRTRTK